MLPLSFVVGEVLSETAAMPVPEENLDAAVVYLQFFLMQLERKLTFFDAMAEANWVEQVTGEVRYYIDHHLGSSLRLQELANVVSISESYLSKIFKQATGKTITEYIQQARIEKAIDYLFAGTLSISQIAAQLGFYDQFHFSKTFKAFTGMAPSIYRSAVAHKNGAAGLPDADALRPQHGQRQAQPAADAAAQSGAVHPVW